MNKNLFLKNKGQRKPTVWPVYAGTSLCTQLGFHKYEKCKFSSIMAEIWNESHIVWEPFQTPIFEL